MDSKNRCSWANCNPMMQHYHDSEWGVPIKDARRLWETLMLEGFQAGLSWAIILRKRDAFRKAFANFDPIKVAEFDQREIENLLSNTGIVRSRAKIEATIAGAKIFNEMQQNNEDFADFCWSFTNGKPIRGTTQDTQTELSLTISKEMKRRGFKFTGPTIVYAWMQAVGIVNDHSSECFRFKEITKVSQKST